MFFLKPRYQSYTYKKPMLKRVFLNLLFWNVAIALALGLLISGLVEILNLDVGENEIEKMFGSYSPILIFFLAIILAPLMEESIFRGPLVLFKKSRYFPLVLYISIFLFGLVHLFNFESYENALWFAPFLFLPQIKININLITHCFAFLYYLIFVICCAFQL